MKKKVVMNWSGGKDSALALHKLLMDDRFEVVSLLTTIQEDTGSSTIHAIPKHLLELQADKIGLPIRLLEMNENLNDYADKMHYVIEEFKSQGVTHFAFGDLYLEDIKKYRESKLNPVDIEVVEPLWNMSAEQIFQEFINSDIQSVIIVTQADKLDYSFVGKIITKELMSLLPNGIDILGENGEYHSFVYDAPFFHSKINFSISTVYSKSYNICLDNGKVEEYQYWQAKLL